MKKLGKKPNAKTYTIEAFDACSTCSATCNVYCAGSTYGRYDYVGDISAWAKN